MASRAAYILHERPTSWLMTLIKIVTNSGTMPIKRERWDAMETLWTRKRTGGPLSRGRKRSTSSLHMGRSKDIAQQPRAAGRARAHRGSRKHKSARLNAQAAFGHVPCAKVASSSRPSTTTRRRDMLAAPLRSARTTVEACPCASAPRSLVGEEAALRLLPEQAGLDEVDQ